MATYFSSDQHFGHERVCALSGRPFSCVEEMNETLIENWNATVTPDDTVYVLGDVVMGHIDKTLPLCAGLNGRKILVSGNHDRTWVGYGAHYRASAKQKQTDWAKRYKEEGGFISVFDGSEAMGLPLLDELPVLTCHFPYTGDHTAEERYLEYRPKDDGQWLLHGHVHEEWKVRGRMINVGVDVWDYTPVSESTLVDLILGYQVDNSPLTR